MRQPRMIPSQRLVGSRLQTLSGEDLGQVEDVILDTEYGRAAYVIASLSGLGQPDQLHAIPMEAIRLPPDGDRVMVTADRRLLENAPAFERVRWPDATDPNWGTALHSYYGYEPYWEARAPAAVVVPEAAARRAQAGGSWPALAIVLLLVGAGLGYLIYAHGWPGARDRIPSSAQAAFDTVEATSKAPATTAPVKTALALSKRVAAFDINVDSKSGRVTLSGQVPSEEMKEMAVVI